MQWTYGYDAADQLISAVKRTTGGSPTVLASFGYRYDTAGNRTAEQVGDVVTGATHDAANRLLTHTPAGVLKVAGQVNEVSRVTVDGVPADVDAANGFVGRKQLASGTNTFTVAATDMAGNTTTKSYEVEAEGASRTFTYDANGNTTSDGTRTFEWDAEDRLLAVVHGTHRSEFSYDGDSRRIRIVEKESGTTVRDAALFWAGTEIIEERISTSEVYRFFGQSEQHNGSARYVTRDHLGSVREVSDTSGAVVTRNDYDPYGRLTRIAGTEDSRFGFTGHYRHAPSGLELTLYRAYDPSVARWLSLDPIREAGGINLYAYVLASPIGHTDRLGLHWSDFIPYLDETADVTAAFGDTISFGVTSDARRWFGTDVVDICSTMYRIGEWAGLAHGILMGGGGILKGGAQSLKTLLYDGRKFRSISRAFWRSQGGAAGRALHHWLIPQSAKGVVPSRESSTLDGIR